MHLVARAAFIGSLFVCAGAEAQVQEEIRRCASLKVDAERLACYDRLFRDSSAQSRPVPSAPAAGAPAAGSAAGAVAAGGVAAGAGAAPANSGASAAGAQAPAGGAAAGAGAGAAGGASAATGTEFGTNPRLQEEQRRKERESQGSQEVQELHARIKKVDPHPYGLHMLTLDNGQVWQQKEKVWEIELKPGDEVVIRRGMLGSFRMQLDGKGASASVIRVK